MTQHLPATCLLVCCAFVSGCTKQPPVPDTPSLSKADYQRAIFLKNRGLGNLENKEWDDAATHLSELAQLLPTNKLALRNLAVARVLMLTDRESPYTRSGPPEKQQEFADAVDAATQAIEAYRRNCSEPYEQALCHLMEGKLAIHAAAPGTNDADRGFDALHAAADAFPEAADFRFALALAMDDDRNYGDPKSPKSVELLEQLQHSFRLAPQNLFALQKLLQRQALFLNAPNTATKRKAAELDETLEAALPLLEPFNETIKQQRRIDLIATITKSLSGFTGNNTNTLMQPAMVTANLLLPEIATQIDQRQLNRNILEYVLWDFDEAFLSAANESGAIPPLPPTVVTAFTTSKGLPSLTGVTDVEFMDMNQDGRGDLIVAREGVIEVYGQDTATAGRWSLLMASPDSEAALTELLPVDIDRDYDKTVPVMKAPQLLRDRDGDRKIVTDPAGMNRWFDADLDIVAWGEAGVVILQNSVTDDGSRSLNVLPQNETVSNVTDVAAVDLEMDGDLDLVYATDSGLVLWQNVDGQSFLNTSEAAALPQHGISQLHVGCFTDDVAVDVAGVFEDGGQQKCGVLENILHGRFRWRELPAAAGDSESIRISAAARNTATVVETGSQSRSLITADFDNDSYPDLLCISADGQSITCRRGGIDGSFEASLPVLPEAISGATVGDVDDDGDVDIIGISATDGSLILLSNEGGNSNRWIDVVARAVPHDPQFPANRVNMHGIGSTIEMRAGGRYSRNTIQRPITHLGLGSSETADVIRIIWTDGIPQDITTPDLLRGQIGILAPQILKGSCPYIYTWTGDRFEFFSDCLWAAPLGLMQASGELAPTREWEHLLIPGDALVENDGHYQLQFTEELWETAYFDQVELTAVDHPIDVQIFTNEKVGPPSLAAHRVHTVSQPRLPISVVDSRGADLLPGLEHLDGDYVQAFQGRTMQGLTDEWFMEFDLGELDKVQNIRLFLTGWVFPTDTSLNQAIQQNPNLSPPAPPSLEVPDGDGKWKTVRPFIGFPSGKTKAMVVDISDLFENGNSKFRLRSSMELYWDQAFFTVNETDADVVTQTCRLNEGNLHYRGFSYRVYDDNALFRNGRAPEGYDYQSVTTAPRWPTISGRFTRYGQVTPLLTNHDDQMAVMGPGDELTLKFAVPKTPVPEGWKRDFVLRNVGYDKDADLNTVYGQTSEPFPFRGMTQYPFSPDEAPSSPEYRNYIDQWQTREYSRHAFQNAIRYNPAP